MLPRGTMWRIESAAPMTALLIEATNGSYLLPEKGLVGPHADLRSGHAGHADDRRRVPGAAGRRRPGR